MIVRYSHKYDASTNMIRYILDALCAMIDRCVNTLKMGLVALGVLNLCGVTDISWWIIIGIPVGWSIIDALCGIANEAYDRKLKREREKQYLNRVTKEDENACNL